MATVVAGLFGATLRKWLFDDKKPAWYYGFAVWLVMEVLHMLLIFFTNIKDVQTVFAFVKRCSLPMILTNALSVMLALLAVSLLGKEKLHREKSIRSSQSHLHDGCFWSLLRRFVLQVFLALLCRQVFQSAAARA